VLAIDPEALGPGRAFRDALRQLLLDPGRDEGLAAQPAAAGGAAPERQEHARIVEAGQDRLLDLIEGDRPARDAMLKPLERAWNLADALFRIVGGAPGYRIVIDDGLQHQGVIGVEPEGD